MREKIGTAVEKRGIMYLNTTPHSLTMMFEDNGEEFVIPAADIVVNARPVEKVVLERNGIKFVTTVFEKDLEQEKMLKALKEYEPNLIIIGSIIAAQAYKGLVVGMTPIKGYERVAPAEKKMSATKFNIY